MNGNDIQGYTSTNWWYFGYEPLVCVSPYMPYNGCPILTPFHKQTLDVIGTCSMCGGAVAEAITTKKPTCLRCGAKKIDPKSGDFGLVIPTEIVKEEVK